ncbi:kallikrein-10-like [Sabethes cyaneus]|uniref:kallikrein-10-like n=1 Tax=Sabethes cyaneus TaxID=53552 RepID=UPI00237DA750|nr:kallikrein-10-like [Sabethes cyaneus]
MLVGVNLCACSPGEERLKQRLSRSERLTAKRSIPQATPKVADPSAECRFCDPGPHSVTGDSPCVDQQSYRSTAINALHFQCIRLIKPANKHRANMKLLPIVLAIVGVCVAERIPEARMMGGTNAAWGQFGSTVSITTPFLLHCGGVIVDRQHVLTSAQCVLNTQNRLIDPYWLSIVAGDIALAPIGARRQTRRVSHIFVHPQFNVFTQENDLAVLRLDRPYDLPSNTIDIARRATRITPSGQACQFAGWGATGALMTEVNVLQRFLPITVNDRDLCNQPANHAGRVRETMICAGNVGASTGAAPCNGNLGTGLYCNRQLVGILSFGVNCGNANNPPVFTQVRNYDRWIVQQFNQTQGLPPNWTPAVL